MIELIRWGWRQRALRLTLGFTAALAATLGCSRVRESGTVFATIALSVVALLAAQTVLAVRARRSGVTLDYEVRIISTHWVQSSCQLAIYLFWGLWWPAIYQWFPLMLAQLFFLFAFSLLLSLARKGRGALAFTPVPIILSTGLFLWFRDEWFFLQFGLVALAAIGKEAIRWTRGGRSMHIFNPSAFALTVAAAILIATGTTRITWGEELAYQLARPPHIELVIFGLGLIVQSFFGVTLMTLAAAASLWALNAAYTSWTGLYWFVDQGIPIPVFLGMTFLFTDPATSPRSSVGRVIYGVAYGVTAFAAYGLLDSGRFPLFYDKLIAVPVMNLFVRRIDALAARPMLRRIDDAALSIARFNRVHIGVYVALFFAALAAGQIGRGHPGNSLAFWQRMARERRRSAPRIYARLLRTAALRGSGAAANEYGLLLAEGDLVARDTAEAARSFARACALGASEGCLNLAARRVFTDEATAPELEPDVRRALDALEDGAKKGAAQPAFILGSAYETGRGRAPDPARAIALLEQAALGSAPEACARLGHLFSVGGPGIEPDHARAARWLECASAAGDADSLAALGILYLTGDGVPKDEARARTLIEKASALGHPKAREWAAALAGRREPRTVTPAPPAP